MNEKIIIAGFGGQGIMSLGQMLAYAGMMEEREVSWLPSYGPEMRGGSAFCHVIISSAAVGSPVINTADTLLVMNLPSLDSFEGAVKPGGVILVNSSLIQRKVAREDVRAYYIPANELAGELGNARVAGMIMLGAYLKLSGAVATQSVLDALIKVLGGRKANLVSINEAALGKGAQLVGELSKNN